MTLPVGVVINPGRPRGLARASSPQDGIGVEGPPSCPSDSKVGEVEIATPLSADTLKGNVYLLQSNPPELQAAGRPGRPGDGRVREVRRRRAPGRKDGAADDDVRRNARAAVHDFKLSFSGGAQAALATPTGCGTYDDERGLHAVERPFVADAFPSSSFAIDSGPGGSACVLAVAVHAAMTAGSTTDQAGGFTDFSLLLSAAMGSSAIEKLAVQDPGGSVGDDQQGPAVRGTAGGAGTCSAASQIGHTVVEAGPGPYPLVVPQPGQPPAPIYLTGGYKGAPYGLSIVVPLIVGPFKLGTLVVRATIEVDPHTAQLTVTTDPLPSIIDGIPTDLRTIDAVIDRPGFMFNPTDCVADVLLGARRTAPEGASAPISSHFQMGSCRALTFKPNFKVSTLGEDVEGEWGEPGREDRLSDGAAGGQPGELAVEHRAGQSRTAQAAAVAVDDVAEGVHARRSSKRTRRTAPRRRWSVTRRRSRRCCRCR